MDVGVGLDVGVSVDVDVDVDTDVYANLYLRADVDRGLQKHPERFFEVRKASEKVVGDREVEATHKGKSAKI